MEQLIVCQADDGRYAVRPVSWAGIWDKSGLLASECKSIAYFDDEQDAKDYIAYRALGPVEELTALVKARDEGRIKVGDRVKVDVRTWGNVWNFKTIENGKFLVGEVVSIIQTKRQLLMKIRVEHNVSWKRPMKRYPVSALGITVFPTRAEAEAALSGGAT